MFSINLMNGPTGSLGHALVAFTSTDMYGCYTFDSSKKGAARGNNGSSLSVSFTHCA